MTPGTKAALVMITALLLSVAALFIVLYQGGGEDAETRLSALQKEGRLSSAETLLPTPPGTDAYSVPAATPAPAGSPEEPEKGTRGFILTAAGAVSAPRAIREAARGRSAFDFSTAFLGFGASLKEADLALCTLETLTDDGQPYDAANAPESLLDAMKTAGFTLVSLATEHLLDKGYEGLDVTRAGLMSRGMESVGVRDKGEYPGTILRLAGVNAAVLGYTYGLDEAGTGATRGDERGAAPLLTEEEICRDIVKVRSEGAEAVILLLHWGVKNRADPPESIRALARRLAEAGADVILGAHPGVVQPCELLTVKRADGRVCEAFVCYSLGCLLSDARSEEGAAGAVLRIPVEYDQDLRLLHFGRAAAVPTYMARQEEEGRTVWRLVEADSESALSALTAGQKEAAYRAAARIRSVFSDGAEAGGQTEP